MSQTHHGMKYGSQHLAQAYCGLAMGQGFAQAICDLILPQSYKEKKETNCSI